MIGIDRARLSQGPILSGKSVVLNLGFGPYDGLFKGAVEATVRERKIVMGSRRDGLPIGITAGNFKPGSLGFDLSETTLQLVREQLAAQDPNGTSYGDVIGWTTTISLSEPLSTATPILYTYAYCWVMEGGNEFDFQSADELKANFKIGFLRPDANGLTLFSSQT